MTFFEKCHFGGLKINIFFKIQGLQIIRILGSVRSSGEASGRLTHIKAQGSPILAYRVTIGPTADQKLISFLGNLIKGTMVLELPSPGRSLDPRSIYGPGRNWIWLV